MYAIFTLRKDVKPIAIKIEHIDEKNNLMCILPNYKNNTTPYLCKVDDIPYALKEVFKEIEFCGFQEEINENFVFINSSFKTVKKFYMEDAEKSLKQQELKKKIVRKKTDSEIEAEEKT